MASAGKAGNVSFSFGMEISGIVLKRSNFEMFFQDKDGAKTELVEVTGYATLQHEKINCHVAKWNCTANCQKL